MSFFRTTGPRSIVKSIIDCHLSVVVTYVLVFANLPISRGGGVCHNVNNFMPIIVVSGKLGEF